MWCLARYAASVSMCIAHVGKTHGAGVRNFALAAGLVGAQRQYKTINCNVKSEPNTWLVQDSLIHAFYFQILTCSLLALLASMMDWLLNFLISELPAVSCIQHSFLHLTLSNKYVVKAQQHCPLRPRNVVLTSTCNAWIGDAWVPERAWPEIDIPKCDRKVTFLSVTAKWHFWVWLTCTYICTYPS